MNSKGKGEEGEKQTGEEPAEEGGWRMRNGLCGSAVVLLNCGSDKLWLC